MGAGDISDSVIEGCQISGIYGGAAISIKNGDGVIIRNNGLENSSSSGLQLGVWAPYEPGFQLANVQVVGNTIRGCDRGVWALPSNGGTFTNIQLTGNIVSGNRVNYDLTGAGIINNPGSAEVEVREESRPGDDSSPESRLSVPLCPYRKLKEAQAPPS